MGNRKIRDYVLSDGSITNAPKVAAKANLHITTARCRLARTDDPKLIYAAKSENNKKGKFKSYILDDGSVWTIPEIVKKAGITKQCAAARLHVSKDAAKVLRPKVFVEGESSKIASRAITRRMYFDPDGFWKIFNRI